MRGRRLAQVKADDARREGQQRPIVGELAAERVDQRHRLFAHAMHQARDAERGAALEDHRIEQLIDHAIVNDVHALEAADRFEVNVVVEHQKIAALHQGHAHAPGQEAVFGVERVARPRREHDDERLAERKIRRFPQGFEDGGRRFRDRRNR
jgi:hypothetical protein